MRDRIGADRQLHVALDLEQRLVRRVAEEPARLELHAAGELDEELPGLPRARRLDLAEQLEGVGAADARVAERVSPRAIGNGCRDRSGRERRCVRQEVAVEAVAEAPRRLSGVDMRVLARATEGDLVAVDPVERDAGRRRVLDVEPDLAGQGAGHRVRAHGRDDRQAGVQERHAAVDIRDVDLAGAIGAGREEAERVSPRIAVLADQDRSLARVDGECLRRRPVRRDRHCGRLDAGDVERQGAGRQREDDVDEAAVVQIVDAADAAGLRVRQTAGQLQDREAVALRRVRDAVGAECVGAEGDVDLAGDERARQVVAPRVTADQRRCGSVDEVHAGRAGARDLELVLGVDDRRCIDRVTARRRQLHVDVVEVRCCDAADREVDRSDRAGERRAARERDLHRTGRVAADRPVAVDPRRAGLRDQERRLGGVDVPTGRAGAADREHASRAGNRRRVERPARERERHIDVALTVDRAGAHVRVRQRRDERRCRAERVELEGLRRVRVAGRVCRCLVGDGGSREGDVDLAGRVRAREEEAVGVAAEPERMRVRGRRVDVEVRRAGARHGDRRVRDRQRAGTEVVARRRRDRQIDVGRLGGGQRRGTGDDRRRRVRVRPRAGRERDGDVLTADERAGQAVLDGVPTSDRRRVALVDRRGAAGAAGERDLREVRERCRIERRAGRHREVDVQRLAFADEGRDDAARDCAEGADRRARAHARRRGGAGIRNRRAAGGRAVTPGAADEGHRCGAGPERPEHVVAHDVAGEDDRRERRVDRQRAQRIPGEDELATGQGRGVEVVATRDRERDIDRLRACVDDRRERGGVVCAEVDGDGRCTGGKQDVDRACRKRAVDPVAHGAARVVGRLAQDRRCLGRVERCGADPRAVERKDRRRRGDCVPVDGVAGRC